MFRDLRADEIVCRVAQLNAYYLRLLLYKDARVDMTLLDETYGINGWKREHQLIGDRLYCTVSIWDTEKGQWIGKQDVGTESYTEKEKGQASDSFKRACVNLGIGRELYTAPDISIKLKDNPCIKITEMNGKRTTYDRFYVKDIKIENKKIVMLKIAHSDSNNIVYEYPSSPPAQTTPPAPKAVGDKITPEQIEEINGLCKQLGTDMKLMLGYYKVTRLEHMTFDTARRCIAELRKKFK